MGVPLMIVLLALSAPAQNTSADELEAEAQTEQVEVQPIDHVIESGADCTVELLKNG